MRQRQSRQKRRVSITLELKPSHARKVLRKHDFTVVWQFETLCFIASPGHRASSTVAIAFFVKTICLTRTHTVKRAPARSKALETGSSTSRRRLTKPSTHHEACVSPGCCLAITTSSLEAAGAAAAAAAAEEPAAADAIRTMSMVSPSQVRPRHPTLAHRGER